MIKHHGFFRSFFGSICSGFSRSSGCKLVVAMLLIGLLIFQPLLTRGEAIRWEDHFLVAHGLGGLNGNHVTNSREAFLENYELGHRLFEVDLTFTFDGYLVARHDPYQGIHRNFMASKIKDQYSPLDLTDLLELMVQYDDAYIITDTKYTDKGNVQKQFRLIVETAERLDASLLDRVIPQIYHEEMYDWIDEIYHFDDMIYTLYQTSSSNKRVIEFAKEKGIQVIVCTPPRFNAAFARELQRNGLLVYVHTFNTEEDVLRLVQQGADGVYTDELNPGNLALVWTDTLELADRTYLYDRPEGTAKTTHALSPQRVTYTAQIDRWYRVNTWLGPRWIYHDETNQSIVTSRTLQLHTTPDENSKISAQLSPQVLNVVEYGEGAWVKVRTWLGDMWIKHV